MILAQAILRVRSKLGEIRPKFWTDQEIINDLNQSAQRLCSEAKSLIEVQKFDSVGGQQEYLLNRTTDEVMGVSFLQGTQLREFPIDQCVAQGGTHVQGTPTRFYIRDGTLQLTNQEDDASITITNLWDTVSTRPRKVLGFWPIPASDGQEITVYAYAVHPWMQLPSHESAVPQGFEDIWIAYAVAQGKAKEGDMVSYGNYMTIFENGVEKIRIKQAVGGNVSAFPRMQIRSTDYEDGHGSSWIYVGEASLS